MRIKIQLPGDWRGRTGGGAVLALVGLCVLLLPMFQWLSYLSFDLLFWLRPAISTDEVVIVYMDETSRKLLGQPVEGRGQWDRLLHAKLLRELTARRARMVVFDILFDEPSTNPVVDEQFAAALRECSNAVLAASATYADAGGEAVIVEPLRAPEPIGAAAPWGVAELLLDGDRKVRRHPDDPRYPGLAWKVAEPLQPRVGKRTQARWINYYGPHDSIPHRSYYQVLEPGGVPRSVIEDKVVFVGKRTPIITDGGRSTDACLTPYRGGQEFPGVEVQATICLNLLRRDWYRRLPLAVELVLILGTGLALGYGLPAAGFERLILWGGLLSLAAAALALLTAAFLYLWFPWAIVSLVQVPGAVGWLAYRQLRRPQALPDAQTLREPAAPATPVPDHQLVRCIGEGSYGQVWLAKSVTGTYRAVKIVARNLFDQDGPFEREFRGIQHFEPISRSHEGFVDILHVGRNEREGYFYYVMELADDQNAGAPFDPQRYVPKTLSKEMARCQRIPLRECVAIGIAVSGAIHRLHQAGLIHRDIKPDNIIFVEGKPKLADIGLVAEVKGARSYVGTEGFIPPEGPVSAQADIYSLGMVLYEIGMGRDRRRFPELPTQLGGGPEDAGLRELNAIIVKACQSQPRLRYKTALRMQGDLKRLAKHLP